MRHILAFIPFLLAASLAPGTARAQSGGAYQLEWSTLGGGGQTFAAGGAYTIGGTTGQPDAGPLTGSGYALEGGFWHSAPLPTTGVEPHAGVVPAAFAARIAGANPFRGSTAVQFDLPAASRASVALYGVDGRLIRQLVDGVRGAGRHTAWWDGRDRDGRPAGPGMYFARIRAGEARASLRLVRVR